MPSKQGPLVSDLPQLNRLITAHDADGKAIVHSAQKFEWQSFDEGNMDFSLVYATSKFPPDLNGDADLTAYNAVTKKGLGLVNPKGTIIRCVDFAPGYHSRMHRTQSLDYGIVLEGFIDMVLDSGEVQSMKRGDVAVQRGTMHQWVNTSETEWARMIYVLQDCTPLEVGGKTLREDLAGADFIPPSGN